MADDNDLIDQNEIEKLLQQQAAADDKSGDASQQPAQRHSPSEKALGQSETEAVLEGAGQESRETPGESPVDYGPAQASSLPAGFGDADKLLKQEDIDRLLNQSGREPLSKPGPSPPEEKRTSETHLVGEGTMAQGDVEYLLNQAEHALRSLESDPASDPPPGAAPFQFEEFLGALPSAENATLDLVSDVELDVKIELGRTDMHLEDVLKLRKGSVVPLDKLAGDPVDIYVNERLIARGEVLVLNDNFCVRVGELIAGASRRA